MKSPSEEDLFNELVDLVENDPRIQNIDVASQPRVFILHIGGQTPFWECEVDRSRLESGNLSVYAKEIVDKWQEQRD